MKLTYDQIKNITTGAVNVSCVDNRFAFFRFTKEQIESYKARSEGYHRNTFSTAGIKLRFKTNSKNLFIKIETEPGSSRKYFSLDVLADGKLIGSIENFSEIELPDNYVSIDCAYGEFSKSFVLGEGIKEICIHMPWSVVTKICDIELDDGAFVDAVKRERKLLVFGDSISQGYDALRPTSRHIAKLSDALCADELNKAIGGERFWPHLASLRDDIDPDYIIVAYGTNDWRYSTEPLREKRDEFIENCNNFFENLKKNYPNSTIFAITPLWREDAYSVKADWEFDEIEMIISAAAEARNIKVIRGFDIVPHDTKLFGDLRLHPNDNGFVHYFNNLYSAIKGEL